MTVFLTSAILGHLTGIGRNRMVKNSVFGIGLIFSGLLLVLSNGVMAGSWEVLQEYDREHDYFAFFFLLSYNAFAHSIQILICLQGRITVSIESVKQTKFHK